MDTSNKFAILGMGLVAPSMILWGMWLYTGDWLLQSTIQDLEEAGHPLTAEQMHGLYPAPDPADAPHAGDLYTRVFDKILLDEHRDLRNSLPIFNRRLDAPPRGTAWPEAWLENAGTYLGHKQEARRLIRQAAGMGPAYFPIEFEDGFDALLPHLGPMRSVVRILRLEVVWLAHDGRTDEAVEVLEDLWNVADALRDEPVLISQLVRSAMLMYAAETTEWLLLEAELTEPQLQRLQHAAESTQDDGRGLRRAIIGERVMGHLAYTQPGHELSERMHDIHLMKMILRSTGLYALDHAYYLRAMGSIIDRIERSEHGTELQEWSAASMPPYALVSGLLMPAFGNVLRSEFNREASIDALVAGLAAARYKRANGEWPDTLANLVPEFLDAVPTDPYADGAALRYRRTETGAIVYSLGHNRTDHGGRERNEDHVRDHGRTRSDTDITFTLGNAQQELWPERWPD